MKLSYEIITINLAQSQYNTIPHWPTRLTLTLWAALAGVLATAMHIEYAIRGVADYAAATSSTIRDAIRITTTIGRVAGSVISDALAYRIARALAEKKLEGLSCA